jgi:hypothetical protein
MIEDDPPSHQTRTRMAGKHCPFDPECVEERNDVA